MDPRARLQSITSKNLELPNGLDMLHSMDYKVFEDRQFLDDVDTVTVGEHFRTWSEKAPREEQSTGPARSQRNEFCLQVDVEAL